MSKYNSKFLKIALEQKYNSNNVNYTVTILDKLNYEVIFTSQNRIIAIYDIERLEIKSEISCIEDVFEFIEEQYHNYIQTIEN